MAIIETKSNFLKAYLLPVFLFFAAAGGIFAQEAVPAEGGFTPFISQLQAETRNNLVRLSWQDSPDVRGPVYIFRSLEPFSETPVGIPLAEVSYGTRSWVDETEGSETVYYFAAASDTQGRRYDIIIPYNNTIPLVISGAQSIPAAPVVRAVEEQHIPFPGSGVSGITVRAEGEGVIISYQLSGPAKSTVLYRSVEPLRRTADLLNAVIVQSEISSPFTDYPVPGIPYYYAVIFEDELTGGNVTLSPGYNATERAVTVKMGNENANLSESRREIRSMPLPLISIYNAVPGSDSYSEIPKAVPLGPDASKAIGDIKKAPPSYQAVKRPRAFKRDLEAPAGGEDSALRTIVQGPVVKRDWQTAKTELLRYLSLPHSGATEARARFYLGQAFYFSGGYREALIEFLGVQNQYPDEANEWIEAVLAKMVE